MENGVAIFAALVGAIVAAIGMVILGGGLRDYFTALGGAIGGAAQQS